MKSIFALLALAALPAALAHNPHDAGVARRHHQHQVVRRADEVAALPTVTPGPELNTTHSLGKRSFTNARATYYAVGLGACGKTNVASDFIVALNSDQYGGGYPGPECFKQIKITYKGISAIAEIRDECPGCPYAGLDMSEGLFQHFTSLSTGVFYMTWEYVSDETSSSSSTKKTTTTTKKTSTSTSTKKTSSTTKSSSTKTSSSTKHSSTTTSHSHSSTKTTTETTTEDPTTTETTSTEAPTATQDTGNNAELLQAILGMTDLLSAASNITVGDDSSDN